MRGKAINNNIGSFVFFVLMLAVLPKVALSDIHQTVKGYEFTDNQRHLKAVFPKEAQGLEKIIYDGDRGISLKLLKPPYTSLKGMINGDTLSFAQSMGESFNYTLTQEGKEVILKEWIQAPLPNISGGSEYVWQVDALDLDARIQLRLVNGSVIVDLNKKQIVLIKPIIFYDKNNKLGHGQFFINGNILTVKVKAKKEQYPLRIDPSLRWGQWLGGSGVGAEAYANAVAYNSSNSTVLIGGYASSGGAVTDMAISNMPGAFAGASEGFVVEISDGGTPSVVWGQWLGGDSTDQVTALAVNGTKIYAGGITLQSTGWESVTFQGSMQGSEGFVVEINDGGTPSLAWGQWLGGAGTDQLKALIVSGSTIYAGGYSTQSTSWEAFTFQGGLVATEGFVVKINDGGTPSLAWGQWLGGSATDVVNALSINGTKIYAGGYSTKSTSWEAMTFQGVHSGGSEGFVVEINDGGTPSLQWGQWLGGSGDDVINSVGFNGSVIYAGGYSSQSTGFEAMSFQGVHSGGNEGFVIAINDGGTPGLQWGQWLGGTGDDLVDGISVNGTKVYAGGTSTVSTSFEAMTFQGTHSGGGGDGENFVVEINDGGTPSLQWGQWLGTSGQDFFGGLASSATHLYYAGYSNSNLNFETVTFQGLTLTGDETYVVNILDGGTPSLVWGQWLGNGQGEKVEIDALAVSGSKIYAGGSSFQSTGWESVTFQGAHSGGSEGFVVEINDGGTPSLVWGQWLGGTDDDYVKSIQVSGSNIYVGGYATLSTGFEAVTFQGVMQGLEAFVVKMTDGGTPTLNWGQWLGGSSNEVFYDMALSGSNIYVTGWAASATSFETVTFQGSAVSREDFVVKIADGGTPSLVWGQWLGGDGNDEGHAVAVDSGYVYSGGNSTSATSWELSLNGSFSGGTEAFVVKMSDGGTPALVWGQWLGGTGTNDITDLVINSSNIYVSGTSTLTTGWESVTFQGVNNNSSSAQNDAFVIKMADGGTPALTWGQWLGGTSLDSVNGLIVNSNTIYAVGYSNDPANVENSTLFQGSYSGAEGFIVALADGGTPSFSWGQWLGSSGNTDISTSIALGSNNIYVGGYSLQSTNWESVSFQGSFTSNQEGWVIKEDVRVFSVGSLFFDLGF